MSTSEDDYTTTHAEAGEAMAAEETEDWQEVPDGDESDEESTGAAVEDSIDSDDEEDVEEEPGTELVVSQRRESIKITLFGGHTHRVPTQGFRKELLEKGRINVGPSIAEISKVEMEWCKKLREILRRVAGPLCIGFFSGKGGDGKSTLATLILQLFFFMNPVRDKVILIDMNTSMTTLDELNGLKKEDFLSGKYWTMESLWEFLSKHPNPDKLQFDEINRKLAYRKNPQLPIIPNIVAASEFAVDESKFNGAKYLLVLEILKRFFNVIVHDFGTDTKVELTQVALAQQHMLGVLTHSGKATTEIVGGTLEMLRINLLEQLMNCVVIFNLSSQPSRAAKRAIDLERAGKKSRAKKLLEKAAPRRQKTNEIQTPGQAIDVINRILRINNLVESLSLEDIELVGFDPHLAGESEISISKVTPEVRAQLWTVLRRLLKARVEYEERFLALVPEGDVILREQMKVHLDTSEADPRKRKPIYEIGETAEWRRAAAVTQTLP